MDIETALENAKYDDYLKHREGLDKLRIEQLGTLDRAVLTLSSSAIGFSIVLFTTFVKAHNPVGIVPLWIAWAFFVVAIVQNLLSYWVAAKSIEIDMDDLDAQMEGKSVPGLNWVRAWAFRLTGGGVLAFICGVVFLLIFAFEDAIGASQAELPANSSASSGGSVPAAAIEAVAKPADSSGPMQPVPATPNSPAPLDPAGATGSKPPATRPGSPPPTVVDPVDPSKPK
ncbi:alanine and proline-rich secreted protein Apa [Mesorhizobium sp. M0960]|uniref:hypothetical protein n=1 Tax=Mesorhizobium sp. M0960 TaxID=2957035 RepID=UPI0033398511